MLALKRSEKDSHGVTHTCGGPRTGEGQAGSCRVRLTLGRRGTSHQCQDCSSPHIPRMHCGSSVHKSRHELVIGIPRPDGWLAAVLVPPGFLGVASDARMGTYRARPLRVRLMLTGHLTILVSIVHTLIAMLCPVPLLSASFVVFSLLSCEQAVPFTSQPCQVHLKQPL